MFETLRNLFGRKRSPSLTDIKVHGLKLEWERQDREIDFAMISLNDRARHERIEAYWQISPWSKIAYLGGYSDLPTDAELDAAFADVKPRIRAFMIQEVEAASKRRTELNSDLIASFQKLADDAVIESASEPLRTIFKTAKANTEGEIAGTDIGSMTDAEYDAHLSKLADDAGAEGARP